MIAAVDEKLGIATDEGIPWHIPTDSRYFKEQTTGQTVMMGYATYLEFQEPMPGRHNLVVDERASGVRQGFVAVRDAVQYLRDTEQAVWVIGGDGLFKKTLHMADELYLTHIEGDYACNKFFPNFSDNFELKSKTQKQTENSYSFYFAHYVQVTRNDHE